MPTRRLPANADLAHIKHEAADLLHGQRARVPQVLHRIRELGAEVTIVAAAAMGRASDVRRMASVATDDERSLALAFAAQHGHTETVRILLDAGADAAGFTPPPGHSHATPLHQAALCGHGDIARLLLQHGASLEVRDIIFNATPEDWARHAGFSGLADLLR